MSSAILYLAIVAIWAFLLVPRWVRRTHADAGVVVGAGVGAGGEAAGASGSASASASADAWVAEYSGSGSGSEDHAVRSPSGVVPEPAPAVPGGGVPPEIPEPDDDTAPIPAVTSPAGSRGRSPAPRQSRGKILQARRRLMTMLVLLALAAGGCTALRLTSLWVCAPPAVMLGMYLLLLRETAVADAEQARRRAEQAAARRRERARVARVVKAEAAEYSAQIIDISARLGDQLYDQYEDAAVRAVGD